MLLYLPKTARLLSLAVFLQHCCIFYSIIISVEILHCTLGEDLHWHFFMRRCFNSWYFNTKCLELWKWKTAVTQQLLNYSCCVTAVLGLYFFSWVGNQAYHLGCCVFCLLFAVRQLYPNLSISTLKTGYSTDGTLISVRIPYRGFSPTFHPNYLALNSKFLIF